MTTPSALIIEDDFDAANIFAKALEANGVTTSIINDGQDALNQLQITKPDIVILDLHLPNVDGTEILNSIRSTPSIKETLVIIVSADARMASMLEDSADLVILKPATFTQVRDFSARLLRRRALAATPQPAPPAVPPAVPPPPVETTPTVTESPKQPPAI